jgi:predicted HD phosphohydrolase
MKAELPPRPTMFDSSAVMIEKPTMADITAAEWRVMEAQRARHDEGRQARAVLDLMRTASADPSFGYAISMYAHGLQAATLALQAGESDEFVIVCLLHDIGFTMAGPSHGEFSAALLRPYISERNRWVLEMHQLFGFPHMSAHPDITHDERERFRGHPYFEATANFVARYDQNAVDPRVAILPIEAFEPMVHRLFAQKPSGRFQDQ